MVRLALTCALVLGCASAPVRRDLEADRAAVMKADADFDADVAVRGIEGWISWFEPTATNWSKAELFHDRQHYLTSLGPLLSKPGTKLRWQPAWAETSGDIGYSTGKWQLHERSEATADKVTETGKYCTVWRRQADGSWRVIFDMGNDDR
jgi:ketosteroid isomerase-like protein